jgi:large subunit ribosomal protein L19
MNQKVLEVANKFKKHAVVDVRTGDVVKVSQRIKEGSKERTQVFEGLVIRVKKKGTIASSILVRKLASGVWVEKGFMLHSPSVENVEVLRRQKVRRNYLTYMRERAGKNTRLKPATKFDKDGVNTLPEKPVEAPKEVETKEDTVEADKENNTETTEKSESQE